ncbi:MAG: YidC/Oxa1 family insertase periplasmic-domain containing protein, partial [Gemmatimonadetes bacterium]|nr:YidC/Oxa1 family insertase periplasmic-domain containing protein [Gemmatimonadota bacterium]
SAAPAAAAPVRAETTLVTLPRVAYRFASVGAAPVSAVMTGYRSLAPGAGANSRVELARPGMPLLRYQLVVPGDTIDLRSHPFAVRRDGAGPTAPLTFEAATAAGRVVISYAFTSDTTGANAYMLRVSGRVEGPGAGGALLVELPEGLASAEADSVENQQHLAVAYKPLQDDARGIGFSKLDAGELQTVPGPLSWVVSKSKYFLVGLLTPVRDSAGAFAELRVVGGARTSKEATNMTAVAVERLRDGAFDFEMYAGPQEWRRLLAVGRDFENANPYGGWFQNLVQPFATIVMRVLLWMHESFKLSYGWVLVIFGVAIRLALWPLNQRAMRTQMKMQRLQPQLQAVQERHKGDPAKLQQEMMKVYAEHGMSPFSTISGCLPVLLPWPILATLFFVFQNTIEFRGVPFLWLSDISLKDPYYILPLLMAGSMFLLSWIGMRNMPPNPQAKLMAYMMPVLFIFMFLNFAAGLNLYYAVQNIAALPQQWLIANERAKAGPGPGSGPVGGVAVKAAPKAPQPRAPKSRRA